MVIDVHQDRQRCATLSWRLAEQGGSSTAAKRSKSVSYRSILAIVGGRAMDRPVLEATLAAARLLGCSIEVLHARVDPLAAMPLVGDGVGGGVMAMDLMRSI